MEDSGGTHSVSADESDSVVVQTEPSSSLAGEHGSDEENAGDPLAKSSDLLAKGLSSILSTVIRDFDFRAQQTLMSQNHLSSSIDRLTGDSAVRNSEEAFLRVLSDSAVRGFKLAVTVYDSELDQLLEDAPLPFIMQHAAKISSVRRRVSSLNSLLKSIQGRIDNVDRMLSIGTTHEKTTTDSSG